jgi:hypothetical protein
VPVAPNTVIEGSTDADIELVPGNGRLLVVDSAALHTGAVDDDTAGLSSNGALDTDARAGLDGVVVTSSGASDANGAVSAGRRLTGFTAAQSFCGIQVVIATSSSATCEPDPSNVSIATSDGLSSVDESANLCGVGVAVAGSATTDCDGSSTASVAPGGLPGLIALPVPPASPPAAGLPTLAESIAAAMGPVCGTVVVAGESLTTCANTPQAPGSPGAEPSAPGAGGGATAGATGGVGGTVNGISTVPGAGGSQAQPPGDDTGGASGSGGSLPLTGARTMLMLAIAGATLAEGLFALRLSRPSARHLL